MFLLPLLLALLGTMMQNVPSEAFWEPSDEDYSKPGFTVALSNTTVGGSVSKITRYQVRTEDGRNTVVTSRTDCLDLAALECDISSFDSKLHSMSAIINLPACSDKDAQYCIESLMVSSQDFNWTSVPHVGYSNPTFVLKSYPQYELPKGSSVPLFRSDSAVGESGVYDLAARAKLVMSFDSKTRKFVSKDFSLHVSPYRLQSNGGCVQGWKTDGMVGQGRYFDECHWRDSIFVDGKQVAKPVSFLRGTNVKVAVRIPTDVQSFFRGRVSNLHITQLSSTNRSRTYEFSGSAVVSPRLVTTIPWEKIPADFSHAGIDFARLKQQGSIYSKTGNASVSAALNIINDFRALISDKSSSEPVVWSLQSDGEQNSRLPQACLKAVKGLAGTVSTNAMVYSGDAPIWDGKRLRYQVAGTHYLSDGQTLNLGTYDLILKSEFARCLYGFSNAPISATVTVVGESDSNNIATTVVSEKNGWLRLAAYGFTFSNKEIIVELSQPQPKTLSAFTRSALSSKQRAEIRAVLANAAGSNQFVCTGYRHSSQPLSENKKISARATAACDYAKGLNPRLIYLIETKTTSKRSLHGKVMVEVSAMSR